MYTPLTKPAKLAPIFRQHISYMGENLSLKTDFAERPPKTVHGSDQAKVLIHVMQSIMNEVYLIILIHNNFCHDPASF
jgi:hypothetical protein